MSFHTYKLVIVCADGRTNETSASGYLAERMIDAAMRDALGTDCRYAAVFVYDSEDTLQDIRREYFGSVRFTS